MEQAVNIQARIVKDIEVCSCASVAAFVKSLDSDYWYQCRPTPVFLSKFLPDGTR